MENKVILGDCMEGMKQYPDNYFELAIVDPPYGIGNRLVDGGGKDIMKKYKKSFKEKNWDNEIPKPEYFKELFRISKNQIIWGGNYFIDHLYNTRGIICWDKKQMMETLSRWEFGWTSFDKVAKTYECMSQDIERFHPTAKPIKLYKFCLENYAKQGDKIFDSHVGSGSSRIACFDYGFEFTGYEIDVDYWEAQELRFKNHVSQLKLF